jgi:hypothetical protein
MKTFAVFGDVHGRITLMLVLARRWEEDTGRPLDGVLQVGDMGAFPDTGRLDRATVRHAARDTDELGFSEYVRGCAEGAALLGKPGWPVVWMRGNHEDFEYLSQFREPTAVDPWGRLHFVPDGTATTVAGVTIGALGGKGRPATERGRGRKARATHRKAQRREDPAWLSDRIAATAYADQELDVLLTHAGPEEVLRGGSPLLAAAARRIRPKVHPFGHHHVRCGPTPGPGGATVIGLDHLEFIGDRGDRLQTGCWGILELDGDDVRWTWGEALRWTCQLSRQSYRGWIPSLAG